MHNKVEEIFCFHIASKHLEQGGVLKVPGRGRETIVAYRDIKSEEDHTLIFLLLVLGDGKSRAPTVYENAPAAVEGFTRQVGLNKRSLDDIQFTGAEEDVAVTWRHLKVRFDALRMTILDDAGVMKRVLEEAQNWRP